MAFRWCEWCGGPHAVDTPVCPIHRARLNRAGPAIVGRTRPRFGTALRGRLVAGASYVLKSLLGEGATSWVFAARHGAEREVAVKIAKPCSSRRAEGERARVSRFEQEACLTLALRHPNICRLIDFGQREDGTPFLVMDRLHGSSLDAALARRGSFPRGIALAIAAQLLEGLGAAHALGIMHRDVKPANVFLASPKVAMEDGPILPVAKLLDFGFAKAPFERALVSTRPGNKVGTPLYMAPEVMLGDRVDFRADLWAVGVILFEMLTGRHPFPEPDPNALTFPAVRNPPARLTEFLPDAPARLVWLLDVALQKDPEGRFPTAAAMREHVLSIPSPFPAGFRFDLESDELIPVIEHSASSTATSVAPRSCELSSSSDSTARIERW